MKNLELTSLKKKTGINDSLRIGFADTESFGKLSAKFRCGSICWIEKRSGNNREYTRVKTFFDFNEYFKFVLSNFDIVYFFNITYDSNFLRNYLLESTEYDEFAVSSGNRLLGLVISDKNNKDFKVYIKDIFPFAQTSLDLSCKEYECKTEKFEVDFDNCSDSEIKTHVENDVKMLKELAFCMRFNLFQMFSVDMMNLKIFSPPSLAIKILRTNFIQRPIKNPFFLQKFEKGKKSSLIIKDELFEYCQKAYKGGFCNAESTELIENVESFDISSSYPFAMNAIRFPMGFAIKTTSLSYFLKSAMKIPSIAHIKAELNIPLICGVREGKLVKLVGLFDEYLTSFEIFSIIRYGGKIIEFYDGLIFSEYDKTNCLAKYARKMYSGKCQSSGGKRALFKLLANSIYGKFAQDYKQTSKKIDYFRDRSEFEEFCLTNDVIYSQFSEKNKKGIAITEIESINPKPFMIVIWGALITAFARLYLLEQAIAIKSPYEDTDSVKCLKENKKFLKNLVPYKPNYQPKFVNNIDIHKRHLLGFWESEGIYIRFRALAPKIYAYEYYDKKTKQIKQNVQCKGVPKKQRAKFFEAIMKGSAILESESYIKIMNPNESLHAVNYLDKSGVFGGIRETKKVLKPEPKKLIVRDE
jgi:hypothetical protein